MNNRSFIQFGGLAALVITLTAWMAVALYFVLVPPAEQRPTADAGAYLVSFAANPAPTTWFTALQAVNAFASLFAVTAVYYRLRSSGQAWAFAAVLIGAVTAVMWMYALAHQIEMTHYAAALYGDGQTALALALFNAPSAVNPYLLSTSGLAAIWFLITGLIMLRSRQPKLLGLLALVAFADLAIGFVGAVIGSQMLSIITAVIAGAVGGPLFWLWWALILLRGDEEDEPVQVMQTARSNA
jgi:hypothetical protein